MLSQKLSLLVLLVLLNSKVLNFTDLEFHWFKLSLKLEIFKENVPRCEIYANSSSVIIQRALKFSINTIFANLRMVLVIIIAAKGYWYFEVTFTFETIPLSLTFIDANQCPVDLFTLGYIRLLQLLMRLVYIKISSKLALAVARVLHVSHEPNYPWHICRKVIVANGRYVNMALNLQLFLDWSGSLLITFFLSLSLLAIILGNHRFVGKFI